jgi:hypothetical protein
MTTGANNFALDIINCVSYQSISNGGVQSAISTLATQSSTYRSQGTGVAAVGVLRDLSRTSCGVKAGRWSRRSS